MGYQDMAYQPGTCHPVAAPLGGLLLPCSRGTWAHLKQRRQQLPSRYRAPAPCAWAAVRSAHGWQRQTKPRVRWTPTSAAAEATAAPLESEQRKTSNPFVAWKAWWSVCAPERNMQAAKVQSLRTIAGKMWRIMRVNKFLLAGAIIFMALAATIELAIPHFTSASIFSITSTGSTAMFYQNIRILAVLSVSYGICAGLRGFLFSMLNIDLITNLRSELFASLLRAPVEFFDEAEVGILTSRLGADCQAVVRCLSTNMNVALRNGLQSVGGAIYLVFLSRELAAVCGAITVVLWAVALRYGQFARHAQRAYQDRLAETNEVAQEVFSLQRIIRAFGTEQSESYRYVKKLGVLREISFRQAAAYLMYLSCNGSLFNITKVLSLLVGGGMAMRGRITPQQLTTFVLYVEFVTSASLSVCDQWSGIMESIGASERVMEHLDRPPAQQLASGRVLPSFSGRVELQDVEYRYPSRPHQPALDGIRLVLDPGRLVALVGLSGSGKSTVVAMLERLYDPTRGRVLADGVDIRELDSSWLRAQLGVVSQDIRLFSDTVAANIAYGYPSASQADIEEAARLANARGFISNLPMGYQTRVTDKLLSGGQRQRIALARALVRKPKLLILDEATSALDAESEAAVQSALDLAMRTPGRSVLVIAHRLSTVRTADEILVMARGRVVESGTHAQLVRQKGIYASLVARQGGLAGEPIPRAQPIVDKQSNAVPLPAGGNGNGAPGNSATAAPMRRDKPSGDTSMSEEDLIAAECSPDQNQSPLGSAKRKGSKQ